MKLNKKTICLAITILVGIVAVISVYLIFFRPRKISEFCGSDVNKFESIYIIDGNTGDSVKLENEDYQELYNILNEVKYTPLYDKPRTGWQYSVQITVGGNMTDVVFSGPKCEINNKEYTVSDENCAQKVGDLYEKVKGAERN